MKEKRNEKKIFNHLDVELLNYHVFDHNFDPQRKNEYFGASLQDYPGRSLCLTNEGDIIQLSPNIRHSWDWITDHYRRIGLSHTNAVIWDDNLDMIKEFSEYRLSTFIFGDAINSIRPDDRRLAITKAMSSKNEFIRLCDESGIPTPRTLCFQSKNEFLSCDNLVFTTPLYLKADVSVSGLGVIYCKTIKSLEYELTRLDTDTAFQLQEEIDAAAFINLQYRADDNGVVERVIATEQILNGYAHCGNIFPSRFSPWHITDKLAQRLAVAGIKDIFAFDVIAATNGEYLALECNPRYNGSTYPAITAEKLGIKSWISKTYPTSFKFLNQFNLGKLEYNPTIKTGVIVVNWGCINQNKLGILIAGSHDEQIRIDQKLYKLL